MALGGGAHSEKREAVEPERRFEPQEKTAHFTFRHTTFRHRLRGQNPKVEKEIKFLFAEWHAINRYAAF